MNDLLHFLDTRVPLWLYFAGLAAFYALAFLLATIVGRILERRGGQ